MTHTVGRIRPPSEGKLRTAEEAFWGALQSPWGLPPLSSTGEPRVSQLCGQKGLDLLQAAGEPALWFSSQHLSLASGFSSITSLKPSFSSGSGAISCLEEKDVTMGPCSYVHSSTQPPAPPQRTGSSPQHEEPTGRVSPNAPSTTQSAQVLKGGAEDVGGGR